MIEINERQYAIIRGLAGGLTHIQIASRMGRSRETLRRDAYKLNAVWGARTAAQLVDRAWRLGMLHQGIPLLPREPPLPVSDEPGLAAVRAPEHLSPTHFDELLADPAGAGLAVVVQAGPAGASGEPPGEQHHAPPLVVAAPGQVRAWPGACFFCERAIWPHG